MTKHKVSELEGALLDVAVAKAEGRLEAWWNTNEAYSVEWSDGGPIIERESISVERVAYSDGSLREWSAAVAVGSQYPEEWKRWSGPTPLIAAMRAYVASKLGYVVELP